LEIQEGEVSQVDPMTMNSRHKDFAILATLSRPLNVFLGCQWRLSVWIDGRLIYRTVESMTRDAAQKDFKVVEMHFQEDGIYMTGNLHFAKMVSEF
jgi:hypothetical protein